MRVALVLVMLAAACTTSSPSTSPSPSSSSSSSTPPDSSPADASVDSPSEEASDAGIDVIDGSDGSDGPDAYLDGGVDAWTHHEFPEVAYPNGWLVANQGASPNNYATASIAGASALDIFTSDPSGGGACSGAGQCTASQCVASVCRQRVKQKSPTATYGAGVYQWRIYVASFTPADAQTSVGAFVYSDDTHELDFECGPGKATERASATLKHLDGSVGTAAVTDMLCHVTSQANPFMSTSIAVPLGAWHTYELRLAAASGANYSATWKIDDVVVATQALAFGPAAAMFQAFVSVENLGFIGDTYPTGRNDAYFDWFRHRAE